MVGDRAGTAQAPLPQGQGDVITLTLPGDGRFVPVARMVVGGLASRLDLPYERLDDLQLAVETAVGGYGTGEDVTVEIAIRPDAIEILVSPLDVGRISDELERGGEELSLGALLSRIVDAVGIEDRDGRRWLRLTKQTRIAMPR